MSCRKRCLRERIVGRIKSLSEAGAERPVVDGAADLEQKISALSRPAHLLRFVHPAVHQEVGGAFGDRGADPQAGSVPFGIVDQPLALAGKIAIQRVQGSAQLSRRCDGLSPTLFVLKVVYHRADAIDADLGILGFAVPQPSVQPVNLCDDHCLRRHPGRIIR